jgi:hypothetical protein
MIPWSCLWKIMLRLSEAAPTISALATVVYAVFSILLWRATRTNAEIAERTAEVAKQTADATKLLFLEVNRPQISFDIGRQKADKEVPLAALAVTLKIVNTGKSPAKDAQITMRRFVNGKEVYKQSFGPVEIASRSKHEIFLPMGDVKLVNDVLKGVTTLEILCDLTFKSFGETITVSQRRRFDPGVRAYLIV